MANQAVDLDDMEWGNPSPRIHHGFLRMAIVISTINHS
jgi:hypothetical protein